MLKKEIFPCLITLFVLVACSSSEDDYIVDDENTDSNDTGTSSDSESNGDLDTGNPDTNSDDTGTETLDTSEFTCESPAQCINNLRCNAFFNNTPVPDKTCPQGQTCCLAGDQSTDNSRPLCITGGEGYQCVNNLQCLISGRTVDDSYRCTNTNLVCCHTDESQGTSSETETETETETDTGTGTETDAGTEEECPAAFVCTQPAECTAPDVVHDEYICGSTRVCCEEKSIDIDAGIDAGLIDGGI